MRLLLLLIILLTISEIANAAPTLVSSCVVGNEANSASITTPSCVNTAGNFLIITTTAVRPFSTLTITDTVGDVFINANLNVFPFHDTIQDGDVYVWYVASAKGGSPNTFTTTPTSGNSALEIHVSEWSGMNGWVPDMAATAIANGSTGGLAFNSGAKTTSKNGELIFGYTFPLGNATPGAGFTGITFINGDWDEYQVQATAGSVSATFTSDNNGTWLAVMQPFMPAGLWSGLIDPSRAVDWSSAGVVGDIPSGSWSNCTTAACNTLFGGSVTATTIQNALASCPASTVVRIPAGTFSVGAFNDTQSNCVLRGAGADQTKLNMTSSQSGGGWGGTLSTTIHLMSGAAGVGHGPLDTYPAPSQTASWTAGYSKGTTVITLSNTTGLVAGPVGTGTLLFLDQTDDPSDGWPSAGDLYLCANSANSCSNKGAGNQYARSNGSSGSTTSRSQVQVVTVTGVSGNQVTISPGLIYSNWRVGQNPGAYWNTTTPLHNAGLEDFSLDFTNSGGAAVMVANAANAWVKGLRFINTATDTGENYTLILEQSQHVTIRSNYFYGKKAGSCSPFPVANYVIQYGEITLVLIENNIIDSYVDAFIPVDPSGGNVIAYNYAVNGFIGVAGAQPHGGGIQMELYEGNTLETFMGDDTHGSHFFFTLMRNLFNGHEKNNSCTEGFAMAALTNNRFFNAIGNVAGDTSYTQYEATLEGQGNCGASSIFNLGGAGCNSGTPMPTDTNVKRTFLRWGNWDMFTSTNRMGTNDQTGTRFVAAEVPSGITNFSNPLPASQVLPVSFYLTSKPSWFGNVPFPAIGPDVANGNATNTSTTPSGGHANRIPARACYEAASVDPSYSSFGIKAFNATTCYSGAVGSPTVSLAPTSLAFGNQPLQVTSAAQNVTLTNTGTASLTITSVTLTGANPTNYSISSNPCGGSLGAGLNCIIGITFTPSAIGSRTANLTFTTSASSSPDNIPLTGTGQAPAASFSPTSATFNGIKVGLSSSPIAITLTNVGNATMSITSITLTGASPSDYSSNTTCGATLTVSSSCAINVTFSPLLQGLRGANISMVSNTVTSPDLVPLAGIGFNPISGTGTLSGTGTIKVQP